MSFDDLLSTQNGSLLHTDSDMELEDEIEMQELVIQEYNEKTSVFRFGTTNHKINEAGTSVIFELKGPNKKKTKSADCASCKVVTF